MFAVVRTGGKQYFAYPEQLIKVEKINAEPNAVVELNDVLVFQGNDGRMLMGKPVIPNAMVKAQVVKQMRSPKIIVFKKHRRHNYRRKRGHRQNMTLLRILDISVRRN